MLPPGQGQVRRGIRGRSESRSVFVVRFLGRFVLSIVYFVVDGFLWISPVRLGHQKQHR